MNIAQSSFALLPRIFNFVLVFDTRYITVQERSDSCLVFIHFLVASDRNRSSFIYFKNMRRLVINGSQWQGSELISQFVFLFSKQYFLKKVSN